MKVSRIFIVCLVVLMSLSAFGASKSKGMGPKAGPPKLAAATSSSYVACYFGNQWEWGTQGDGSYYSMMNFFDRVAKLERIVNVSNLLVANTKKGGEAKAKHAYQYAPNESVVATCMATTFFSHDQPVATPATAKGRI